MLGLWLPRRGEGASKNGLREMRKPAWLGRHLGLGKSANQPLQQEEASDQSQPFIARA
jgi:hypothetical protein